MRRVWIVLPLLAGLALPADAGLEYRARTWQEGKQKRKEAESSVLVKVDGDKARIEFEDSGNPWMPKGSYLVTRDAGDTLELVKPEDNTCGEFDLDAMMQMVGALTSGGLIDIQIDNARVEALPAGPGKTVAGLPTRHARYRTSYDMRMKILGMKRMQHVETVQDIYSTDEIGDRGMGVWLRREPPRTNSELDELIDLEVAKIRGFPLETVETMTTVTKKGKESTITTHLLVSDLRRGVSFPAGTFGTPPDCQRVQLMPTQEMMAGGQPPAGAQDEGQPQEEEKGGVLGRFKRLGKKKDG